MKPRPQTREGWVKVRYSDLEEVIRTTDNIELRKRIRKAWVAGLRRDPKYAFPKLWRFFRV